MPPKGKFTCSVTSSTAMMLFASPISIIQLDNRRCYGFAVVTLFHDLQHFVFYQKSGVIIYADYSFQAQGKNTDFGQGNEIHAEAAFR